MIFEASKSLPSSERVERDVRYLVAGIVHALPQVALGQTPLHTARSRADDFRAAFAAIRKH